MTEELTPIAGVGRRFAAMIYDALLLIALAFVVTAVFLPITHGEAVQTGGIVLVDIHRVVLVLVWIGFYGLFWTRSGQTLGMTAWRMKLVRDDGAPVSWRDVLVRLAVGVPALLLAGLGFWWMWIDRDGLAWHDRISHTRPVVLPKRKKS